MATSGITGSVMLTSTADLFHSFQIHKTYFQDWFNNLEFAELRTLGSCVN